MRKSVAIAWLTGGTFAVLVLGAVLLTCCILPFHDDHHREPLCHAVAGVLSGEHHDPARTAEPAERPLGKGMDAGIVIRDFADPYPLRSDVHASSAVHQDSGARNAITLGALRVDDDVGLHTLFCTFLI